MTVHRRLCIALIVSTIGLTFPVSAQLLEWRSVTATADTGESTFVGVETCETAGIQNVFMAGNGRSDFQFGNLKLLALSSKPCGIVVGSTRDAVTGNVAPNWQSRAESSKTVTFTDLALLPDSDRIVVCGRFENNISFKDNLFDLTKLSLPLLSAISLSPGFGTYGFVAILDRKEGTWISAFSTPGILPNSISCDSSASVIVTGQGALAARFSVSNGSLIWKTASPPATTRQVHVAVRTGSPVFVIGEESGSTAAEGVVLNALNPATGSVQWTRRMGGPGIDTAGGLAIDGFGKVHVVFNSDYGQSSFAASPILVPQPTAGGTLFTASISDDGSLGWIVPISRPSSDGTSTNFLECPDIAVDSNGSTWLACSANGNWTLGDSPATRFDHAPLIVHVDAAGNVQEWFRAHGEQSTAAARAIAVGRPHTIFSVGDYSGISAPSFGSLGALSKHTATGAYFASLEVVANQQLWVARPNPSIGSPLSIPLLRNVLGLLGASVYVEIDADPGPKAISFWATPSIIAALSTDTRMILNPESQMIPNGVNYEPGWGLARLGGSYSATGPYKYAEAINPVRLYLIDTAIANTNNWIGANPNLTLEKSILIRGSGDPVTSSEFRHGTKALSLVGGVETGAAVGTPVKVVSYDIYPQGGTSTVTLLAKAVTEAVKDHRNSSSPLPAAICIAASSATAATSYTLKSSIEMALAAGIPVIVSAGNLGASASNYIPSAYGSMHGVICTGAADSADLALSSSNYGSAVDVFAPGKDLRTYGLNSDSPIELMTGTSPAAALTVATALTEISINGIRTPAEIEGAIKAAADSAGGLLLVRNKIQTPATIPSSAISLSTTPDGPVTDSSNPIPLTADPTAFTNNSGVSPDSDGDGIQDLVESFHGCDPTIAPSVITLSPAQEIQFTFPIAADLFDGNNPFMLRNGYAWRIECGTTLSSWSIPVGSLSKTTDSQGRVWITATFPATMRSCFVRIQICNCE